MATNVTHYKCAERKKAETRAAIDPEDPVHTQKKLRRRLKGLTQRAKLWSPFDRRLVLQGIRCGDTVLTSPDARLAALAAHWGPIFCTKRIDENKAIEFLSQYSPTVDLSLLPPPTQATIEKVLKRVSPSAPGPDGLPYA
eukprot:5280808-Pyramimonas_sp.AAC.1